MPLAAHLDVVNAACTGIGVSPLGNDGMDEDSDVGQAVASAYWTVLDFNLGVYLFGFAQTTTQLSVNDLATPLTGYSYVFDMPAEAIGEPLWITDSITNPARRFSAFKLQERTIHASKSPLYAQIRYRPEPNRWSPAFRAATITALQASLALSHREDKGLSDQLHERAYGTPSEGYRGGQFGAAIRADAFSVPPRQANWDNNPLTNAWRDDATGSVSDD